jgi:hypothetical protein
MVKALNGVWLTAAIPGAGAMLFCVSATVVEGYDDPDPKTVPLLITPFVKD